MRGRQGCETRGDLGQEPGPDPSEKRRAPPGRMYSDEVPGQAAVAPRRPTADSRRTFLSFGPDPEAGDDLRKARARPLTDREIVAGPPSFGLPWWDTLSVRSRWCDFLRASFRSSDRSHGWSTGRTSSSYRLEQGSLPRCSPREPNDHCRCAHGGWARCRRCRGAVARLSPIANSAAT